MGPTPCDGVESHPQTETAKGPFTAVARENVHNFVQLVYGFYERRYSDFCQLRIPVFLIDLLTPSLVAAGDDGLYHTQPVLMDYLDRRFYT